MFSSRTLKNCIACSLMVPRPLSEKTERRLFIILHLIRLGIFHLQNDDHDVAQHDVLHQDTPFK